MGRSQRHLRYKRGYDSAWDPAYYMNEPSLADPAETFDYLTDHNYLKPNAPAVNTEPPTCGLAGGTFTCAPGEFFGNGTVTFQWFVQSQLIPGATGISYTFAVPNLGKMHSCRVAKNDPAGAGYAFSNEVKAA